jgi:hypothetical protein
MSLGTDDMDEHPPSNVTRWELWTVSVVNAIMQSNDWNSTAILLTWDEGGGYYDHVPPPQVLTIDHGFDHVLHGYGERVPLLVISPYSRENYVSKQTLNHMSLLHFIEDNWNLPYLNQNVAQSQTLSEFFDFHSRPRPPIVLGQLGQYNVSSYPAPIQGPDLPATHAITSASSIALFTNEMTVAWIRMFLVALSSLVLYTRWRRQGTR